MMLIIGAFHIGVRRCTSARVLMTQDSLPLDATLQNLNQSVATLGLHFFKQGGELHQREMDEVSYVVSKAASLLHIHTHSGACTTPDVSKSSKVDI